MSWQCCAFVCGERSINRDAPPQVPATTARPGGLVGRSMLGLRTISEAAGVVAEPRECIGGILQATCKVAYKPNKSPEWQRASSQTKGGRVAMPSIEDPEVTAMLSKVMKRHARTHVRTHAFTRSSARTCLALCPAIHSPFSSSFPLPSILLPWHLKSARTLFSTLQHKSVENTLSQRNVPCAAPSPRHHHSPAPANCMACPSA